MKFELSERTSKLVGSLRMIEKGGETTYRELSDQTGFRIDAKNCIYARKILQRDHAAIFTCIKSLGLRRLTDPEIATRLPKFWLHGARNKLTRGSAQADVVELKQLDIDEQVAFSVASIQGELAQQALSRATRTKMEKIARGTSNDLPSFTAVEWAISLAPKAKSG